MDKNYLQPLLPALQAMALLSEDEAYALFKSLQEAEAFLAEAASTVGLTTEAAADSTVTDTSVPGPEELEEFSLLEKSAARSKARKKKELEAAVSHLPPGDRPSSEDLAAAQALIQQ